MANNSNNPYEILTNDLDRIKKREKYSKKVINENIDQVLGFLEETNTKISQINPNDPKTELKEIKNEFQSLHNNLSNCKPLQSILSLHKDYYAYISKMGKNLDKHFNPDINEAFEPVELDNELIKALISEHLIREGKFELEEIFNEEAGILATTEFRNAFQKLHQILKSIKNRDLGPAIEWVQNKEEFRFNDSKLLFGMHKLQFASILVKEGRENAIFYARANFPPFARFFQLEIQKLMTSILFKDTLMESPYSDFYNEKNWAFIEELIIQETCKMIKKSPECSLYAATTAGTLALPKFLKFSSVASYKSDWKDKPEIPIEVEIGKDFKYHSIFICPVSKEISNIDNPPMLLKCGHVISQHSLKKMSNNNNKTKFKCPTCPTEQTALQVHEIRF